MLYLVRKQEESIIVNGDIEIKIVEINRNSVKLGVSFPESATVFRKEVVMRMALEKNDESDCK